MFPTWLIGTNWPLPHMTMQRPDIIVQSEAQRPVVIVMPPLSGQIPLPLPTDEFCVIGKAGRNGRRSIQFHHLDRLK
jgi:hypothetical protein